MAPKYTKYSGPGARVRRYNLKSSSAKQMLLRRLQKDPKMDGTIIKYAQFEDNNFKWFHGVEDNMSQLDKMTCQATENELFSMFLRRRVMHIRTQI